MVKKLSHCEFLVEKWTASLLQYYTQDGADNDLSNKLKGSFSQHQHFQGSGLGWVMLWVICLPHIMGVAFYLSYLQIHRPPLRRRSHLRCRRFLWEKQGCSLCGPHRDGAGLQERLHQETVCRWQGDQMTYQATTRCTGWQNCKEKTDHSRVEDQDPGCEPGEQADGVRAQLC